MKKLKCILSTLFILCLMGCDEVKDEEIVSQLVVDPLKLEFPYSGGNLDISINNNTDWEIANLPEWLSASDVCGVRNATVTITASPNPDVDDRNATFFIFTHDGSKKTEITVTQGGTHSSPIKIIYKFSSVSFGGGVSSDYNEHIDINCDTQWTVEGPSWITAVFNGKEFSLDGKTILNGSGTMYMRANEANDETHFRSDTLFFKTTSSDEITEFKVYQKGLYEVGWRDERVTILSDGVAFEVECGSEVKYFACCIREGDEIQTSLFTYEDINQNWTFYDKLDQAYIFSDLKPNTYYVIYYIGITSDGYYAPLSQICWDRFCTPTDENQPRTIITGETWNGKAWDFDCHLNEYAVATYSLPLLKSSLEGFSTSFMKIYGAYLMQYNGIAYFSEGTAPLYFIQEDQEDVVIVTRAINKKGELSNVVDCYTTNFFSSAQ